MHVRTKKRVASATVDIECFDYGGYAKLEAWAATKNVKGYSKYDQNAYLVLPEDQNKNHVADKWEKDVGVYDKHLGEKEDGDEFPKDQADDGDGTTLFEEYRGFYAAKDYCKEDKHNLRKGKFIRTDPNWKDVFVYDATNGVFTDQYAPTNASELNWHIVGDDQMKHIGSNTVNARALMEGDNPTELVDFLDQNDHRWINCNTPTEYRLDKHFGLFLFYSDRIRASSLAGQATLGGGNSTPVAKCQYVELQKYDSYKSYLRYSSPFLIRCSNYPGCPYTKIGTEADADKPCPRCGASLTKEKYLDDTELGRLAQITYEGTIIHEIGHGIGIVGHHSQGVAKFTDSAGDVHAITGKDVGSFGEEAQAASDALAMCGVVRCAMRYNLVRMDEYRSKQLLGIRLIRYCRANEIYLDDYGNRQKSDNCFRKITVK
jgi:hypothetical protein